MEAVDNPNDRPDFEIIFHLDDDEWYLLIRAAHIAMHIVGRQILLRIIIRK